VLIVEDDEDIRLILRVQLEAAGYAVEESVDGYDALRRFYELRPQLVILDISMPKMDGWTALERLRELSNVPVLILTAGTRDADKIRAFRTGADDYVVKPFNGEEIVLRVGALLRRARSIPLDSPLYEDDDLLIDQAAHVVLTHGTPVVLSPTEYRLLVTLVRHRGQVMSPQQLLDLAWNDLTGIGTDRVKFCVLRLRRKLGWDHPELSRIRAVRGFGYRYEPKPTAVTFGS